MAFTGWSEAMLAFYAELEVNNTKEFWLANKAVYDDEVRAPMQALVDDLAPEFGEAKIYRPNRDVRFSKDKSPYKTEVSAVFSGGSGASSGLYVRADADGLAAGGGYYQMASDQIAAFRDAVVDEAAGAALQRIIDDLEAGGAEVHSTTLKTAPRGFSTDHPRIALLRRKDIIFMRYATPEEVRSAAGRDFVAATFRTGKALLAWLNTHVGPSAQTRGR